MNNSGASIDWPANTGRLILDETDSTNAHAARLIGRETPPLWVFAHRQTAGRGRRGRAWQSANGNFAASWVGTPDLAEADLALYSFVAALALRDACIAAGVAQNSLSLKWPNDVLLDGKKLAGILLERNSNALIVGIGVNISHTPEEDMLDAHALAPTSLSNALPTPPSPLTFLDILAQTFDHWQRRFLTNGFAVVRQDWLSHAAGLGQRITARTGRDTHTGKFEGIDATGALILDTGQSRLALSAADVYF